MPRQRKNPNDLNDNERMFCARYISMGQNGTRAYMSVWPRCAEPTARVGATRLLAKPSVKAEIHCLTEAAIKAEHMSANEVIREMTRIASADLMELSDLNGRVRRLRDIPERLRRCISSVKRNRDGTYDFKFWSKDIQLTNLGKFHKLLTERVEFHDKTSLADRMRRARLRASGGK